MQAKVLSVYDEGALEDTSYIGAKGIAILIDVDGQKTLFDTGMRGRYLIHNLEHLDVDVNTIDRVVISHNHKSNVNGLGKLLDDRTEPLDVFVNESFCSRKKLFGRSVFNEEQGAKIKVHEMSQNTQLSEHLMAVGPFGDLQEFFLVLKTRSGPVIFSSCYHNGTACVLSEVKKVTGKDPFCLIGGIHVPKANQKAMDPTAAIFKEFGSPKLYLSHCAFPNGITFLRVHFGLDGVKNFYVGTRLQFEV